MRHGITYYYITLTLPPFSLHSLQILSLLVQERCRALFCRFDTTLDEAQSTYGAW